MTAQCPDRDFKKLDLLRRGLIAGINLMRATKLLHGAAEIAALLQDTTPVNVCYGRLEAKPLVTLLVTDICRFLGVGLAISLEGGVVILTHLRRLPTFVPCTGRLRMQRGAARGIDGKNSKQRHDTDGSAQDFLLTCHAQVCCLGVLRRWRS